MTKTFNRLKAEGRKTISPRHLLGNTLRKEKSGSHPLSPSRGKQTKKKCRTQEIGCPHVSHIAFVFQKTRKPPALRMKNPAPNMCWGSTKEKK
jgi:hypothetical protein